MYKDHRIDRRRIVFVVLTLTHIISYQLIECLTIGGDYENGEYTFFIYIFASTKQTIIIHYIHTSRRAGATTRGLIHNIS